MEIPSCLLQYTEKFSVSEPVFKLSLKETHSGQTKILMSPVNKYKPTRIEGDIISELVCSVYEERFLFQRGTYSCNKEEIARVAMRQIRTGLSQTVEQSLKKTMKNPRLSKLFRWFKYDIPNTLEFNNALIMLYKYIKSVEFNTEHESNLMIIIDAMRRKYEKK